MFPAHCLQLPFRLRLLLACSVSLILFLNPHKAFSETPYSPAIAEASQEGEQAISGFRVPEGMHVSLFAAEPLMANPVAFCIDEQGRFYVAETYRQSKGVEDNRSHMDWLHDDLSAETVADRVAYFKKHLKENVKDYTLEHDRIRLVEDRDHDGKADHASVFADGFNNIEDGTGAGVLARGGYVYYTCIPHVWRLKDTAGEGKATLREKMSSGYGVRVAFRGHDLHGLKLGPDGRLYFSIGDRGYNIKTKEGKHLFRPDTGAVFRCNLDGTELEEFAYGLRNPQELAFDDYGNLFTGDNNSDSGDKARWVYVVEGGDTGWRMYYQYLSDRGPFNREKIWHPAHESQPAYMVPPIVNLSDGPSGLVHYPGVGLSDRYKGHFFLADFRGTPSRSGIRSFAVKPKGASFELTDSHEFIWQILATDVDFGYDGSLYVSDWVNGWNGLGKGRIYQFTDTRHAGEAKELHSAELMKEGFSERSTEELVGLLAHPDQRIRMEAQFALVNRSALDSLQKVALNGKDLFARLHAIWGIGQLGRQTSSAVAGIQSLLKDQDSEVRAQTAKVIGEAGFTSATSPLIELLKDSNARVQYFAAIALGHFKSQASVPALFELLKQNNNADPMLRHSAILALSRIGAADQLVAAANNESAAVRLAAVVALRRLQRKEVGLFLQDSDPLVVLEAARAINDAPIPAAVPDLAAVSLSPDMADPLLRRVMNANFRLGGAENAALVAKIAADKNVPETLRLEAIKELSQWNEPEPLDRVLGRWQPIENRQPVELAEIVSPIVPDLFSSSEKIKEAGTGLAAKYGIKEAAPMLAKMVEDAKRPIDVRVASLKALDKLGYPGISEIAKTAIRDKHAALRVAGRNVLGRHEPQAALQPLEQAIESGQTSEKQGAIETLAEMQIPEATTILTKWMQRLVKQEVPAEIQLDLLKAAALKKSPELDQLRDQFEAQRPEGDALANYLESLSGGNAARGREIFFGRSDTSCRRCHQIRNNGGEVGPDLSGIGRDKDRRYLLEAIVAPNKAIAKGFETAVLALLDGKVVVGIIRNETDDTLEVMDAKGTVIRVPKDEIDERATGKSAMPEEIVKQLSKDDLRDLVEFLIQQKQKPKGPSNKHEG
ncbi:Quinoprotein glucose dehydrogenase B precursor [Gimesia chilikensis]|uniref:Quinoprotein glucose dehydrogenase B n=1 Tax=Gimesia chilikensis TaxID=2605989 RepID=A0A517WIK6_9PLAN|nr:PVC-type heme-binding CxxCH protein [Gimesia chilikensis]QDU05095.1 Quinoprotein glucose dehydrogenase B precursor [Gimesia chilikensis]